jgi:hypothetical protein
MQKTDDGANRENKRLFLGMPGGEHGRGYRSLPVEFRTYANKDAPALRPSSKRHART